MADLAAANVATAGLEMANLASGSAVSQARQADNPAKAHSAAQQFEALLIEQILHSAHESGEGWLGSGGDSAGDCATDYAEQQLATMLAQKGGLGLTKLIEAGLEREQ
jgi:Rod binding domain-containing protein